MSWPYDHDRPGRALNPKDPENPATTSVSYDIMSARWAMLDAVLGGTETMRMAGPSFMPQHDAESPMSYRNRLGTAVLLNVTEITLDSLAGKPFSEPMKRKDDIPAPVSDLFEDVDLLGSNLDTFCRNWFREALAKGFCHVLVDFPMLSDSAGAVRTLEDDRRQAARPYLLRIAPEAVIFAEMTVVNGKEMLTHVRIREQETSRVGFAEVTIDRIRVLEPGSVAIYENKKAKPQDKDMWVQVDGWATSLDFIPLVTFYTRRDGFMMSKPPLQDLAYLNVRHWQSSSDQANILTVTRFPMLACSGVSDEDNIVKVGPNQILMTTDNQGKFYYVEHTGAAIKAGAEDIATLEAQMASYGAEFLKAQPDRNTATARALDSAEALSPLQAMVVQFQDSVSTALDFLGKWLKLTDKPGHVEIDTGFNLDQVTQWEIQTLALARASRDISRDAFLTELKRRRILGQDYNIEEDEEELQEEMAAGLVGSGLDLNPGETTNPAAPKPEPEPPEPTPAPKPSPKK